MNNNLVQNLFLLIYLNFYIYICVQLINNMTFLFNLNNFNSSTINTIEKEQCDDIFKYYNIVSSINIIIVLVYFIVKCHKFRFLNNNIHFVLLIVLNVGFNSFQISNYFINYPILELRQDCKKIIYLESFVYSNIINMGYFCYNLTIYIYNSLILV
jgi:hypothetical protein